MPRERHSPAKSAGTAMKTRMRTVGTAMRGHRMCQARKITRFRVTGGVRSHLKILRIVNTIHHPLHACALSKNALMSKHPVRTTPCIHVDRSLPTT